LLDPDPCIIYGAGSRRAKNIQIHKTTGIQPNDVK